MSAKSKVTVTCTRCQNRGVVRSHWTQPLVCVAWCRCRIGQRLRMQARRKGGGR